jgi:hypothetical protein
MDIVQILYLVMMNTIAVMSLVVMMIAVAISSIWVQFSVEIN